MQFTKHPIAAFTTNGRATTVQEILKYMCNKSLCAVAFKPSLWQHIRQALCGVAAATLCLVSCVSAAEFDLYYLGGQSNMEGFGNVEDLTAEDKTPSNVWIFHTTSTPDQQPFDGRSKWQLLTPGHGTEFKVVDGKPELSGRFGVEVSFAAELRRIYPDRNIALIKYARNGSSIDQNAAGNWGCWEPDFHSPHGEHPDQNQYDYFLKTIRQATAERDIDGDGQVDTLHPKGIVWMQGESDAAHGKAIAQQYNQNLKRLMDLFRAALRQDDLPVVIGRISDSGRNPRGKIWEHGDIVRTQQQLFVQSDAAAALVTSTDNYKYSDPAHYDSAGYLDLGKQFANELKKLSSGE